MVRSRRFWALDGVANAQPVTLLAVPLGAVALVKWAQLRNLGAAAAGWSLSLATADGHGVRVDEGNLAVGGVWALPTRELVLNAGDSLVLYVAGYPLAGPGVHTMGAGALLVGGP